MDGNSLIPKRTPMAAGQRYGRLTTLARTGSKDRKSIWEFRCDCGALIQCYAEFVRCGKKRSCGCLLYESRKKNGQSNAKHGLSHLPEHNVWGAMHQRCKENKTYIDRAINVCARWSIFENFLEDMGRRPSPQHTIERINNDLGYEKDNCKWATRDEQMRNTSRTIRVEINGIEMCLKDAAAVVGIKYDTVKQRIRAYGWTVERALSTPV